MLQLRLRPSTWSNRTRCFFRSEHSKNNSPPILVAVCSNERILLQIFYPFIKFSRRFSLTTSDIKSEYWLDSFVRGVYAWLWFFFLLAWFMLLIFWWTWTCIGFLRGFMLRYYCVADAQGDWSLCNNNNKNMMEKEKWTEAFRTKFPSGWAALKKKQNRTVFVSRRPGRQKKKKLSQLDFLSSVDRRRLTVCPRTLKNIKIIKVGKQKAKKIVLFTNINECMATSRWWIGTIALIGPIFTCCFITKMSNLSFANSSAIQFNHNLAIDKRYFVLSSRWRWLRTIVRWNTCQHILAWQAIAVNVELADIVNWC